MHVGPMSMIIILLYNMRMQCVGTCVRTFAYARVCECVRADERSCVRTLVRAYKCVRECARACGCAHVRARVMLRMCPCMHVRLQVRAGVHAGICVRVRR